MLRPFRNRTFLSSTLVTLVGLTVIVGMASAAGGVFDWLTVGKQVTGGVTYFNGTILNNTTTSGADNPVTFGDNVRIDGRVYRGAVPGTSDTKPFIINDNAQIAGNLEVGGTITAKSFEQVLAGTSAVTVSATPSPSTWVGKIYDTCQNTFRETSITVTFTPTSASEGTWTSNPVYLFRPDSVCDNYALFPTGTYSGSYRTVGNSLFAFNIKNPSGSTLTFGGSAIVEINGNTLTFSAAFSTPAPFVVLTRQ